MRRCRVILPLYHPNLYTSLYLPRYFQTYALHSYSNTPQSAPERVQNASEDKSTSLPHTESAIHTFRDFKFYAGESLRPLTRNKCTCLRHEKRILCSQVSSATSISPLRSVDTRSLWDELRQSYIDRTAVSPAAAAFLRILYLQHKVLDMPPTRSRGTKNHAKSHRQGRSKHKPQEGKKSQHNRISPAPLGFVFVKAGDPYITRHCRLEAAKSGQTCHEILHEHREGRRIGLHVPLEIYERVKALEESTRATRDAATQRRDENINNNARETIKRLYPNIPKGCLAHTVTHAYEKSSGRTGRAGGLNDEQKAKNAVGAHIRHCHTDYEFLLDQNLAGRGEARETIKDEHRRIVLIWEGKGKGKGQNAIACEG